MKEYTLFLVFLLAISVPIAHLSSHPIAKNKGFKLTDTNPQGESIEITCQPELDLTLRIISKGLILAFERIEGSSASKAKITISGLKPKTKYFIRQDKTYLEPLTSSPKGIISTILDITSPHTLIISRTKGTIYIRPDGSVFPETAPISVLGNIYSLEQNIKEGIIIEKDGIIIEGNSKIITGAGEPVGIDLNERNSITLRNVTVEGFQVGILFGKAVNSSLSNSTIRDNSNDGILSLRPVIANTCNPDIAETLPETPPYSNQSCNTYSNNIVFGNMENQFLLSGNYHDQVLANQTGPGGSNLSHGLLIDSGSRNIIKDNAIKNMRVGIKLKNNTRRNSIVNNTISDNTDKTSTQITYGTDAGIILSLCGSCEDNVIKTNTFSGHTGPYYLPGHFAAIELSGSNIARTKIENNTFASNNIGILLNSASPNSALITGNTFNGDYSGIVSYRASNGSTVISGNHFIAQKFEGIRLDKSSNEIVTENLSESANGGFVYSLSSSYCTISNNTVRLNSAITMEHSSGFMIYGNTIKEPLATARGISLYSSVNSEIYENTIQDFTFPILMNQSSNNKIYHNSFSGYSSIALETDDANIWNKPYPQGGNHWAGHVLVDEFSGIGQDKRFSDGFADAALVLSANNKDDLPFMQANGWLDIDTTEPSRILDLNAAQVNETSVIISWTAPGDDSNIGTAREYDLRYSYSAISLNSFDSAASITDAPLPLEAGTLQTYTFSDLSPGQNIWFAIKSQDEFDNMSLISNILGVTTNLDTTPPNPVADLSAIQTPLTLPDNGDVLLTWNVPQDNLGTTDFLVFRSVDSTFGDPIAALDLASMSADKMSELGGKAFYYDPSAGLDHGATYSYKIHSKDAAGNIQTQGNNVAAVTVRKMMDVSIGFKTRILDLRKTKGLIKAIIEPSAPYSAQDIDPATLRITKVNDLAIAPVAAQLKGIAIRDSDRNGIDDMLVAFPIGAWTQSAQGSPQAILMIEGNFADAVALGGAGTIDTNASSMKSAQIQMSANQDFVLGEVYAFPNPAKRGKKPTLHIEAGLADKVDIRIYDIAGDLVHEASLAETPQVIDDGNGENYAFEYEWDISNIQSGVYIYSVTAQKDGHKNLMKAGKCAIIK
ncbi:NosD domain-containing protein [Elusimicrobiota bacterium]